MLAPAETFFACEIVRSLRDWVVLTTALASNRA
jgi:hypothetical protein